LIKRENERQKDRSNRFQSGSRRQITNTQKDLLNLKKRFKPDRFIRRIQQEQECVCDWQQRFRQKFKILIDLRRQQVTKLSRRFRLETIINHIGNEKTKLSNKAATLRAADPMTSLKRGFSLVYAENGDLVKSISQINAADRLKTKVSDGRIISTVDKTERK
jgi:exodeoxyribonuclease VII large subunit